MRKGTYWNYIGPFTFFSFLSKPLEDEPLSYPVVGTCPENNQTAYDVVYASPGRTIHPMPGSVSVPGARSVIITTGDRYALHLRRIDDAAHNALFGDGKLRCSSRVEVVL